MANMDQHTEQLRLFFRSARMRETVAFGDVGHSNYSIAPFIGKRTNNNEKKAQKGA
jgi:hypothetical protein